MRAEQGLLSFILCRMAIPHPLKIWRLGRDVARGGPLADPKRLGSLPHSLQKYKKILPNIFHGKKITFGNSISADGKNATRRAYFPNIVISSCYSRALDMRITSRISADALRKVANAGGFDEYMLSTKDALLPCPISQMIKRKIIDAYNGKGPQAQALAASSGDLEKALRQKYGEEYIQ